MKRVSLGEPLDYPSRSHPPFFIMNYWIYIPRSETTGRIYTGYTPGLRRRLIEHNHPLLGKRRYTRKQGGPLCVESDLPGRHAGRRKGVGGASGPAHEPRVFRRGHLAAYSLGPFEFIVQERKGAEP